MFTSLFVQCCNIKLRFVAWATSNNNNNTQHMLQEQQSTGSSQTGSRAACNIEIKRSRTKYDNVAKMHLKCCLRLEMLTTYSYIYEYIAAMKWSNENLAQQTVFNDMSWNFWIGRQHTFNSSAVCTYVCYNCFCFFISELLLSYSLDKRFRPE